MGYERYPRNSNLGDYYSGREPQDYSNDYGSGRDYSYSSAREYQAAGELGGNRDYGARDHGQRDYGQRGGQRDYGPREYGNANYGAREQRGITRGGYLRDYQGSYGSDGHRFAETDRDRGAGRDYGRQPQGYDRDDRDFFSRAGDEVRSWFGDEEAERRRQQDARYDERHGGNTAYGRDDDYYSWRRGQIDALDRDYDEYRRENRSKFENEFGSWRTERQGQRSSLSQVNEHMDVVGSDGEHIGTVDKVRGDRIVLTKSDADAGGRHHSIPSRWIQSVADKVTIRKTAEQAKAHWRDEERNSALFGDDRGDAPDKNGHMLNRSFSGTY